MKITLLLDTKSRERESREIMKICEEGGRELAAIILNSPKGQIANTSD